MAEPKKKKIRWSAAWGDARELVWTHRRRLLLGAVLMLINQAMGLVLPASTKYLIDQVIGQGRTDLLWKIALAAGAATVVQALTSFGLSQLLGVAAQRAITEMRKKVQAKIARLPVSYFDSTQVGKLISRIMNDAEGIRNLVGTGLASDFGHHCGARDFRRGLVLRLHPAQTFIPRARRNNRNPNWSLDGIARRHSHR